MKVLLGAFGLFVFLFASSPTFAADMGFVQLRSIVEAGGSLILDMDKKAYSVTELIILASSLKYEATLTIVTRSRLTVEQCCQIAKARPGQVIFSF